MTSRCPHSVKLRIAAAALAAIVFAALVAPAAALAVEPVDTPLETQSTHWMRLSGNNRFQTAAAIANEAFPSGCDHAVVATGQNFPDALSASALAGVYRCPILLTEPGFLQADTKAALQSLKVKEAVIVGGEAAVSKAVEDEIHAMGKLTIRYYGANRFDTSVEVAKKVFVNKTPEQIIVATGMNFPDALSVGSLAWSHGIPILLVGGDGMLTSSEVDLIKSRASIDTAYIMGGTSAVNGGVEAQLVACGIPAANIKRFAGSDRYETSKVFAEWALSHVLMPAKISVATGETYPDALTGSSLCGVYVSPILLVKNEASPTLQIIPNFKSVMHVPYIFGGTSAVSGSLETYLNSLTS